MSRPRRIPLTLLIGLAIIAGCEILLFIDVRHRGGVVIGPEYPNPGDLPAPVGRLAWAARFVAYNMTVFCWIGYLLAMDGLLTALAWGRTRRTPSSAKSEIKNQESEILSPLRARPNRFVVAWLTSIPVWCWFDWINFRFMDAWRYWGLPADFWDRALGYFIAFAAISPGMLMAAELYQQLGLRRLRTRGVRIGLPMQIGCVVLGAIFVVYPFVVHDAIGNLTLWVSLMFLLDPINHWADPAPGGASIIGDWRAGRWGRTLALMAGGATCGLLWEFWNYWALSKWTYRLPFVGSLEGYRYFEMPWIGFQGFLPFAIECWVVLNTILAVLRRVGWRISEEINNDYGVI